MRGVRLAIKAVLVYGKCERRQDMNRTPDLPQPLLSRLCLCLSLCPCLCSLAGCRDDPPPAADAEQPTLREVEAGDLSDVRDVPRSEYSRTLEDQFDLLPAGTHDYLVIRDLRPLIAQAERVEQVMAGPLARAAPVLAALAQDGPLSAGAAEATQARLARSRQTLGLMIAALEGSGVELDAGLVIADPDGDPLVLFAAQDFDRLATLARLVGGESLELATRCRPAAAEPDPAAEPGPAWVVCGSRAERVEGYQPGLEGARLAAELRAKLGSDTSHSADDERINVALSLGGGQGEVGAPLGSLDLALRTDPTLWELRVPMPQLRDLRGLRDQGPEILLTGPPQALRALVPGTSFVWARLDPEGLGETMGMVAPLLSGELFLGVHDQPDALLLQAGILDTSEAAKGIMRMAQLIPGIPIEPTQFPDLRLESDRKPVELDGKLVPAIGLVLGDRNPDGGAVESWEATLGVPPRARLWAYGDYMTLAVGELEALPAALSSLRGTGPSPQSVAALSPTLARALVAGEVGLALHLVLDHWQAPLSPEELDSLIAGLPATDRPDTGALAAVFESLAPWSSIDIWLRTQAEGQWVATVSLVPFASVGAPGSVDPDPEAEAMARALDAALTGGDAQAAYAQLLARFPDSPRAPAYRARLGRAPAHHAAVGMFEVSALAALALPAFRTYLRRAKTREASAQTQQILSLALALRERSGSCASMVGSAGPTPPLSVACHGADGGRCRAIDPNTDLNTGTGDPRAGTYDRASWDQSPWSTIGYRPERGHRYHYSIAVSTDKTGTCELMVRAEGDLDGEGDRSAYVRRASIDPDGTQHLPALEVEAGEE